MRILDYFKDKFLFLFINLMLFLFISIIMIIGNMSIIIIFLIFLIWFLPLLSYILIELIKYKIYYDEISGVLNNLDKKYLLPEVIKKPNFIEGKIIYDVLKDVNKNMHEHVNKYRDIQKDYREYIETWVHEIKTPIASTRLIIENNENSITNSIGYEIKKIEGFIDQVLYYSRSNEVNKDYIVKKFSLKTVVTNTVKKNSRDFIRKKIILDIHKLNGFVYSDSKWIEFILNQIIGNSIKYSKSENAIIKIYSKENKNNTILTIEDNGVGIIDKDVNRVFLKGFTGENGRTYGKSTGIGLYLCKKLCENLGLGLTLTSKYNIGTKVNIIFPIGNNTLIKY